MQVISKTFFALILLQEIYVIVAIVILKFQVIVLTLKFYCATFLKIIFVQLIIYLAKVVKSIFITVANNFVF